MLLNPVRFRDSWKSFLVSYLSWADIMALKFKILWPILGISAFHLRILFLILILILIPVLDQVTHSCF